MKNYSFSNITAQDSYNARKSNDRPALYRHSELKAAQANSRIEEIKKKYDTPTRREKIQSLKKSRDMCMVNKFSAKQQAKESPVYSKDENMGMKDNYSNHRAAPTFGGNHLKESFAINRLQKSVLKHDSCSKQLDCIRNNQIGGFRNKEEKQNRVETFKSQTREDEEIIFSKVREMKQSIINNDYMRGSINPRSSVSSSNHQMGQNKRQFDPRVENIDKINAKIKQILSCLAEGQKKPEKLIKDSPSYPPVRQSSLDVGKVQNIKGSYLKGDKPSLTYEPNKQSTFFGKRSRQSEENAYNYKNADKYTEKSTAEFKRGDGFINPNTNTPASGNSIRGQSNSMGDNSTLLTFSKFPREVDRFAAKQYRDYSMSKIDSYTKTRVATTKEEQLVKTPTYVHNKNFEAKVGLTNSQSRSNIDSIRKSTLTDNEKSDVLKSGKKLNEQISKIQKKIEEFQAQKTKLNIQFTPFSMKNRSSSNLAAGAARIHAPTPEKAQPRNKSEFKAFSQLHSSSSAKDAKICYNNSTTSNINILKENELANKQITKNTSFYGQQSKLATKQGNFDLRLDQLGVKTVKIDKNAEVNQETNNNPSTQISSSIEPPTQKSFIASFDEAALRKRTDQGIQERKKRLQSADEIIKTDSFKKLVSLFCEQAKLDQNFRNMKIWLQSSFSKDKYANISKLLSQQGVKLTPKQCESLFKVQQSEHNPFFTYQDFNGSFQSVCKAYISSKNHWQSKIRNKFDRQNLVSQGFTFSKIDLERKGFIELQDLVRLLNIQSGTFYRNRDIFLIFRRFTKGQKASFQEMLRQISI